MGIPIGSTYGWEWEKFLSYGNAMGIPTCGNLWERYGNSHIWESYGNAMEITTCGSLVGILWECYVNSHMWESYGKAM